MNLLAWAERSDVARVAACRWFRAGVSPVPARGVGRLILVDDPCLPAERCSRTRVLSADQRADLDRQVARVAAWAALWQVPSAPPLALTGRRPDGAF
jgi:predicted site-specific integrase-resolvase